LPWPGNPRYLLFWVDHSGTPLPTESDHPFPEGTDNPRFVAYSEGGRQVATSDGLTSRRTDAGLLIEDAAMVGAPIDTGVTLADGGKLRLWFVGQNGQAMLRSGSVRTVGGTVAQQQDLGMYAQPPYASGFYHGWSMFAGPNGTHVLVGTYVGPAPRISVSAPGPGVTSGTARWSEHPELTLFWVAGVSTANYPDTVAHAYDPAGNVLATRKFND
jgi:hypothetical protein